MSQDTRDWTKASIALATMGTIIIILFIVLSNPFDIITTMIQDEADDFGVGSDVDPFITMITTVFGITFSLSMIGLIIWFALGSHQTEHEHYPDQSPYRRPPGGDFY